MFQWWPEMVDFIVCVISQTTYVIISKARREFKYSRPHYFQDNEEHQMRLWPVSYRTTRTYLEANKLCTDVGMRTATF